MRINEESVRRAVDGGLSQLTLTEQKKQAILAQCRPGIAVVRPRRVLRRAAALAAAFALMVTAAAGALAASPDLAQRLDMLSRQALAFLYPVEQSAEQNGIRMEVLAAMNDEDVAVVYMSLQDTAGSGRVSNSVELFDYEISGAVFTDSEVVQYDPASGTALLRLTGSCGRMDGGRVSVTVRSFLTGAEYTELAGPGWTLAEAAALVPEIPLDYSGQYPGWMLDGALDTPLGAQLQSDRLPVLKPLSEPLPLTGWCALSAAGEVDGMLHLQIRPDGGMGRFNRLQFVLTGPDGERLQLPYAEVELGEQERIGVHEISERLETVLELPDDEAARQGLRVNYDLLTYKEYVEGDWSVSFRLDDEPAQRSARCAMDMGGWTLEEVLVTPLGVTLRGQGEMFANSSLDATPTVVLRDGRTVEFTSASTSTDMDGRIEMKDLFCIPVPPQDVAYVEVGGQQILLED